MTQHKDMERAKEVCATLSDWNVEVTEDRYFKITQDGVDRIASLIAQLRNETLSELAKDIDNTAVGFRLHADATPTPFVYIAFKNQRGAAIFKNKLIRNLKQEDKE